MQRTIEACVVSAIGSDIIAIIGTALIISSFICGVMLTPSGMFIYVGLKSLNREQTEYIITPLYYFPKRYHSGRQVRAA